MDSQDYLLETKIDNAQQKKNTKNKTRWYEEDKRTRLAP